MPNHLPQNLTVDAVMAGGLAPGRERLQLNKGSFTMGTRAFAFEPGEVERIEGVPQTNSLVAISQSAGETFTYELIVPDELWRIQQNLSSDPPLTIQDTAAKVFFGKPYADLTPDQQKDIDGKLPAFSGWKQPEASEPNR